jgi:transcriptional regulator with XRE-family HTH domain
MRTLIIMLCLVGMVQAEEKPEPPALAEARRQYESGIKLAQGVWEGSLEKLAKAYQVKLNELIDERTKKGDLEGALAIKNELEKIGKIKPEPENIPQGRWFKFWKPDFENYHITIKGKSITREGEASPNGTFTDVQAGYLLVEYTNGLRERWTRCYDGRIMIEIFKRNGKVAQSVFTLTPAPN